MPDKEVNETKEDIVYDDSDTSDGVSSEYQKKLKKVKEDLKKCKDEKQEYLDGWQRSKADFINFKKRSEELKKDFARYASEEIISQIIPVLDNFEQAFKNKESWEKVDKNWRTGVEIIYNQTKDILKNSNVLEVGSIGEEFDPKIHECVEVVEVEDKKENDKILEITQKGYKMGDKIIRHPNVKVGKIKE